MKVSLLLMKDLITSLPKSALVSLGLMAAASATGPAFQKKTFRSGTTLIIFHEEMNDIIKIVKYLEDSGLLMKRC